MCTVLNINKLDVWYDINKLVLDGLNLSIKEGEILGLLGRNGQGKSTLLNTVSGLHKEYRGSVKIKNHYALSATNTKRMRYYIPDNAVLFDELSPQKYISLVGRLYKVDIDTSSIDYLIKEFQFEEYFNKRISELSLGNKQKTNLIAALAIRPSLIILDEPLNGLDILSVDVLYRELKRFALEGGAVIFSTHIIDVLPQVCSRVAILDSGNIKADFAVNENIDIRKMFINVVNNLNGVTSNE